MKLVDITDIAVEVLHGNMDTLGVEDYAAMYQMSEKDIQDLYEMLGDLGPADFRMALTSRNARKWIESHDLSGSG